MRIALFIPSLKLGGAEKITLIFATELAKRGFIVDLVVADLVGPLARDLPESVRTINLACPRVSRSLPKLVAYLRRERPAVLISALGYANIVAIIATILAGSKTRVFVREVTVPSAVLGLSLKGRLINRIKGLVYPLAHGVIAVSQGVAADLEQHYNVARKKLHVIYDPVITATTAALLEEGIKIPESPYILAVSRLEPVKDLITLIRAFAFVRKHSTAKLMILGEGSQEKQLKALTRDLGVDQDVHFKGYVPNPYPYLKYASVYALSSTVEGLGNTIIQALYCGCAVVSTDCPVGPREILKDGKLGMLVPVGDVESMAAALLTSLSQKRDPLVLQERSLDFSADRILPQLVHVLRQE